MLAVAIDFRDGNYGYPTALVDINYAIRLVKARAAQLQTRPDLIGICGSSSGGHLAMLAAMRPNDPRYATLALPAYAHLIVHRFTRPADADRWLEAQRLPVAPRI